jgi:hypothetical protein
MQTAADNGRSPVVLKGSIMDEAFRLDLNQSWEAIAIKTGHAVLIPKGSYPAAS